MFHHRWSVPIVWVLYEDGPQSFSALNRRLSASRDTLSDTLSNLAENGLVARSPEPRGTYALTPAGMLVGAVCGPMVDAVLRTGIRDVALKKWPMLVLTAMSYGNSRYNALITALPGITPRALGQALRELEEAGLVRRDIIPSRPPVTAYWPTEKGNSIAPELDALKRACDDAIVIAGA